MFWGRGSDASSAPFNPPDKVEINMEKTVEQMEAEARGFGRRHPGFIRPSVLKGVKVTRKYTRHNKPEPEVVKKSLKGPRPIQTSTALSNALKAKWLVFVAKPENTNKVLNQIYADFAKEILQ
jgi:hypothetical protein